MSELMRQDQKSQPEQGTATLERTHQGVTYTPHVDILETADELVLFGDLPGVEPQDLDVRFENKELIIHGRVAPRHKNVEFSYGEYGVGDFYRAFSVGEAVDAEKISAELRNGVLVLHLPKSEAVKPRRIAVKTG